MNIIKRPKRNHSHSIQLKNNFAISSAKNSNTAKNEDAEKFLNSYSSDELEPHIL